MCIITNQVCIWCHAHYKMFRSLLPGLYFSPFVLIYPSPLPPSFPVTTNCSYSPKFIVICSSYVCLISLNTTCEWNQAVYWATVHEFWGFLILVITYNICISWLFPSLEAYTVLLLWGSVGLALLWTCGTKGNERCVDFLIFTLDSCITWPHNRRVIH